MKVLLSDPTTHVSLPWISNMATMHKHMPLMDALRGYDMEPVSIEAATVDRVNGTYPVNDMDALILLGGADVREAYYNPNAETDERGTLHGRIDALEMGLVKDFHKQGKPIIGLCRGAQLINVAFGGTLLPEIADISTLPHRQESADYLTWATTHPVNIAGSRLLTDGTYIVSSRHHQAVQKIAEGFTATAVAPDGIIEMIEHESAPVFGVQWHPEATYIEQSDTLTSIMNLLKDYA